MPIANANGIEIYYELHGSGEPLILIAGLGYDLWMWHKMIPGLSERYQTIPFDNRGMGRSSKPAGPYSAQLMADDVAGLMDALGLERAHVMGHSMGGFIAQAMALTHPDRIDKLILSATNFGGPRHIPITPEAMAVLLDTNSPPEVRVKQGILSSCAPGFEEAQPEIVEEWITYRENNPIEPEPYKAQFAVGLGLLSEAACFEHKLKEVELPTLVLFGEHDKVVPPGNAQLLAAQLPHSEIAILPGAGHFFPIETPAQAVSVIDAFLK